MMYIVHIALVYLTHVMNIPKISCKMCIKQFCKSVMFLCVCSSKVYLTVIHKYLTVIDVEIQKMIRRFCKSF